MAADQQRTRADDIQAITKALYLYCRAVDRLDHELGYTLWHEDGEADYGAAIYQGTGRGFVDFVIESHLALAGHSHQVTNVIIELDGDRAASEAYVTAALRMVEEDGTLKQMTVRGRYLDRWSFRNGRWAIDKRRYLLDFDEIRTIEGTVFPPESTRDGSDPSYTVLDLRN